MNSKMTRSKLQARIDDINWMRRVIGLPGLEITAQAGRVGVREPRGYGWEDVSPYGSMGWLWDWLGAYGKGLEDALRVRDRERAARGQL